MTIYRRRAMAIASPYAKIENSDAMATPSVTHRLTMSGGDRWPPRRAIPLWRRGGRYLQLWIERKTKENAETHLYTVVKVARDEDLLQQIGRDIYFDLVDHDKVRKFSVQNQMPFIHFKDEVAKEFGVPAKFQRFWLWAMRGNRSYRPNRPLTHVEENQSVGQLRDMLHKTKLEMFLEIELGLDSLPVTPPPKKRHDILLFFKLYDPWKEELRFEK